MLSFEQRLKEYSRQERSQKEAYYDDQLWPEVWTRFMGRTASQRFRALILPGTLQHTTASLLIGALNPERVAFLLTPETRLTPMKVWRRLELVGRAEALQCKLENWNCPEGDFSDGLNMYMGLRSILDLWNDLPRECIAVDLTGGKSTMTVALSKAAYALSLSEVYIDSEYEGTQVVEGTQQLKSPPDPYQVFGDLEADRARKLYHAHDYAGAQRIFALLGERVPGAGGQRYTALEKLAALYAAWDVLDFAGARRAADELLAMPLARIPELAPAAALLERQHQLLQTLLDVVQSVVGRSEETLRTLADWKCLSPLLGTLHASAIRRAAVGRYDFAALFRYRCLELISQHRLATYRILANSPQMQELGEQQSSVGRAFLEQQRRCGRRSLRSLNKLNKIGLFDGYMLLAALEDPLVQGYDIQQIEERAKARNTSVLAHGYRLIDKSEYDTFASVVDQVIDRFFTLVLHEPREVWEQNSSFYQLEV